MAAVAIDADVLIAFLDPGDAQHERAVTQLRAKISAGEQLLVGASVYAEVMLRPLERGTAAKVDEFLTAARITVHSVDRTLARDAAQLRARHRSLRLGDALSLATARASGAELLTFDLGLRRIAAREARAAERGDDPIALEPGQQPPSVELERLRRHER